MSNWSAQIQRTVIHTITVDVEAETEEEATEIAEKLCNDANNADVPKVLDDKADWYLDDSTYDLNTIDED